MIAFVDHGCSERLLEARKADEELRAVAAGHGALALAIGDTLRELFATERLAELHCVREKDYMREKLGIPPRTGYGFLKLSRETKGKEVLRRAILCGAITPNKALAIARVCSPELESAWVGYAMKTSLAELTRRVKEIGGEPVSEEAPGGRLFIPMTGDERTVYDAAVSLAQDLLGPGTPRWVAQETIAWEWLGGHGKLMPAEEAEADAPVPEPAPEAAAAWNVVREDVERELKVLAEASKLVEEGPDPFCHNPAALHDRARRLVWARERLTEPLGAMLRSFRDARHWSVLGYRSFEEYTRDRLGLSPRTVRERIWLDRKMEARPEVREALRVGKISYAKALTLVKVVTPADPEAVAKVEKAARQSAEKMEREAEAEEMRQDRALGFLRLWGPAQAMESIRESIEAARGALAGLLGPTEPVERVREGQALAATGIYFLGIWKDEDRRTRRPKARLAVLARKDGLCQVPGCTNPIVHLHHIIFRSDNGSDAISNLLGVCYRHHCMIHAKLMRVWGLAGKRVVFEFRDPKDLKMVRERWVTEGMDDTRRVDVAGEGAASAGGAGGGAIAGSETGGTGSRGPPTAIAEEREVYACAG